MIVGSGVKEEASKHGKGERNVKGKKPRE